MKIPKITSEELRRRYENIKPLMEDKNGELHYIAHPDSLSSMAYTWGPRLIRKATHLEPVTTIKTLHSYGHYSMFKPSVEEVLAQIPEHLLDSVSAFHLRGPKNADDLNKFKEELNAGFQVAFATLYRSNEPKKELKLTRWERLKRVWGGLIG